MIGIIRFLTLVLAGAMIGAVGVGATAVHSGTGKVTGQVEEVGLASADTTLVCWPCYQGIKKKVFNDSIVSTVSVHTFDPARAGGGDPDFASQEEDRSLYLLGGGEEPVDCGDENGNGNGGENGNGNGTVVSCEGFYESSPKRRCYINQSGGESCHFEVYLGGCDSHYDCPGNGNGDGGDPACGLST